MGNRRKPTSPGLGIGLAPVDGVDGDDVVVACHDFLARMGATTVETRFSDDQQPVVWMAVAEFPAAPGRSGPRFEATGAMSPQVAVWRLVVQLADGGHCQHCHRPTGATLDVDEQLAAQLICWYQYDPELKRFRRSCEGDT